MFSEDKESRAKLMPFYDDLLEYLIWGDSVAKCKAFLQSA
jgi:hypothetical protein